MTEFSNGKSIHQIVELHKLELMAQKSENPYKTLEIYHRILHLRSILKNNYGQCRVLHKIGVLYWNIGEPSKCSEYHSYLIEMLEHFSGQIRKNLLSPLMGFYSEIGDRKTIDFLHSKFDLL